MTVTAGAPPYQTMIGAAGTQRGLKERLAAAFDRRLDYESRMRPKRPQEWEREGLLDPAWEKQQRKVSCDKDEGNLPKKSV